MAIVKVINYFIENNIRNNNQKDIVLNLKHGHPFILIVLNH